MANGEQKLYKNVVATSLKDSYGEMGQRSTYKGRTLDKIAYRYYYHASICRLRYDDCLSALHQEFDLTPNTLIKHIQSRLALVDRLVFENTSTTELRRRYPFYDWSGRIMFTP